MPSAKKIVPAPQLVSPYPHRSVRLDVSQKNYGNFKKQFPRYSILKSNFEVVCNRGRYLDSKGGKRKAECMKKYRAACF